jgi:hypothetical protein
MTAWRHVASSQMRTGRGSTLGPDTSRRARWWVLELDCDHTEERSVRYVPRAHPQRGGTQHRSADDVLPAPRRVLCGLCAAHGPYVVDVPVAGGLL